MKRIPVRQGDLSFDLIPLIAHDLRTPLTAIKGLSQLALRRSDIPAPAVHYLSTIVEEANHIATLVDDLVLASRLERGEIEARPSNVDVTAFLRSILDEPTYRDDDPRPFLAPTRASLVAYCDPQILARAIIRLLAVAARRARSNESVSLGAQADPKGVDIWIAPLPVSHLSNGSPNFVTQAVTSNSVERAEDSAPNLSIHLAAKLIEAQRGRYSCDDAPDGYARFHVFLPEARDS